ncbi:MAG TPA: SpoIIE family protein phosphatase [Candidatus Cybelea sp.]|jgi:sigma-B regulation protein RsbU (phosphoserine phosphatase)|nr:SpoIIE family protein phosphatase [Candidatus Cybelea sp.]
MNMERPDWLLQMEDILETLNEGVMILDDCRKILFINSCMEEMLGYPASEVIGLEGSDLYTDEEYKFILKQIDNRKRVGQNRFEFVVPQKNGNRLPVIISSRNFEDPDGLEFAVVTFTDISEQKNAEADLRHANRKLEERQSEIEEDLLLAARVQQSLAPQSLVWGGMRVDAYFHPVRTIGGDFGMVSPLDDRHLNLLVCDVSGHGIGSALVANRIYSETMSQLRSGGPLTEMLRDLNRFVLQNLGTSALLFTLAAARIDIGGRRMIFAGAGHPPAMVVTPGEQPRLLESRSMVLGGLPDAVADEAAIEIDLNPGDRVVLYTDGISEVFDSRGEMLGTEGVQKIVRETSLLPFGDMQQALLNRVAAWREGTPTDDMSLVLLEVS